MPTANTGPGGQRSERRVNLCVSAYLFTQRRKERMLLVLHSDINLRGKGSLRSEYRTEDGKDDGMGRMNSQYKARRSK